MWHKVLITLIESMAKGDCLEVNSLVFVFLRVLLVSLVILVPLVKLGLEYVHTVPRLAVNWQISSLPQQSSSQDETSVEILRFLSSLQIRLYTLALWHRNE